MYKELVLGTLKSRRWLKKLYCFYKIKNNGIPLYLADYISSKSHLHNTQNARNTTTYSCRTDAFKNSFFTFTINEWHKLNFNIRTSSFNIFRAYSIKVIRPIPNSIFGIFNPLELKLITRLWLGLSHLNEHKFNHNFNNCINPEVLWKKEFLEISQNSQENTCARVSFLIKLQTSGTGVFLWILWNF